MYNQTGGELKSSYRDALHWYSEKARGTPERRHSKKLLAQFSPAPTSPTNAQRSSKHFSPVQAPSPRPKTAAAVPHAKNWSYWSRKKQSEVTQRSTTPSCLVKNLKVEGKTLTFADEGGSHRCATSSVTSRKHGDHRGEITIDIGSDYKGALRPKSAMAAIENQLMNPYATSYDINYGHHPHGNKSSAADRPGTSRGYTASYKLSGPIGTTHFDDEYCLKKGEKAVPIRSGTSSGSRSNNPHPDQSFMVWRYPKERKFNNGETSGAPAANRNYRKLTDGVLDEIVRDNFRSTYDQDYMGIPQGYQMKDAIGAPDDWRDQVPRPLDTSCRRTYKPPVQHPAHKLGTSRYDCNKLYVQPAVGIVPTVSKQHVVNQKNTKEKTVYGDEYFDRSVNNKLNRLLNQRCDRDWEKFYLQATSISAESKTKTVEVITAES